MKRSLSVIICTHDPRPDYLSRCLAALQAQTLPKDRWELLVVDNASVPDKAPRSDLSWHPDARLIVEPQLGLTPARLRGIREAAGDLLVFVDDDNVLDPDYLEQAERVATERPYLGSWSGQSFGEFEQAPPEWVRAYLGHLVIRQFETDLWSNLPRLNATIPCGAGLCVRSAVARHYLMLNETGRRTFQLDRTGDSLLSGGDNDLAACACDIGMGVGIIAALQLKHLIPASRLTLNYHVRLAEGIHHSAVILAHLRGAKDEVEGHRVRWNHVVRAWLARGEHRSVQLACLRGRRKGLDFVSRLSPHA